MLRRIGVLASLAVMATMFAGISSAQAQTAGVCIFTGLSGQLQANGAAVGTGIQNADLDFQQAATLNGAPLDVERGSYNFGGSGTCAGVLNGAPQTGTFPITSSGNYDNIVCGTGFAHDLDGNGTNLAALGVSPTNPAGYEIPFVAGNGPLLIGPGGKPALAAVTDLLPPEAGSVGTHPHDGAASAGIHGNVVSNYVGVGAVNILPTSPDNCATSADGDTDQFNVTGFFVGAKP